MSARLSGRERRLLFAYEDELWERAKGRALAHQLGALAVFLGWLHGRGLALWQAWPEDLEAYRRALNTARSRGRGRPSARAQRARFEAVRRLYRFLYCRELLRHDPGAVLDLPARPRLRGRR